MISVILPVRNSDKEQLEMAVRSVLEQSYTDYELVIVDDGSTEENAAVIDSIASEDGRIRVLHIEPSGVSAARNIGIKEAEGDVITFLDGDDRLPPYCFAEAAEILKDSRIDVLFGGTKYVETGEDDEYTGDGGKYENSRLYNVGNDGSLDAAGAIGSDDAGGVVNTGRDDSERQGNDDHTLKPLILSEKRKHKSRAEVIGEPFRFEGGGYINRGIAARFVRKEVFDDPELLFPVGIKMYEDAIWNLRLIDKKRVAYVKRIWYYYFENPESASNKYNPNVIEDIEKPLNIMRRMLELWNRTEYAAYTRLLMDSLRYIYMCMYGNPRWRGELGDRSEANSSIERNNQSDVKNSVSGGDRLGAAGIQEDVTGMNVKGDRSEANGTIERNDQSDMKNVSGSNRSGENSVAGGGRAGAKSASGSGNGLKKGASYKKAVKAVRRHLYGDAPWREIGSRRFRKYSSKRDRQKALLYKMHLLLLYWKLTWKR